MAKVSVVIPTYNDAQYVAAALESVSRQTERDLEVVVVNDGSTDATSAILARAAERDPRIRIHEIPHSGKPAVARNAGLRLARGGHIAFLDADDLYHPEKIAYSLEVLDSEPEIDLVFHDVTNIDPAGQPNPASRQQVVGFRERILARARPIAADLTICEPGALLSFMTTTSTVLCTSSVTIRRKAVEADELEFPEDVTIAEDVDLWFRLVKTRTVAYLDRVLSYYRQHPGSLTWDPDRKARDLATVHMRSYRRVCDVLDRHQRFAYARRIANDLFNLGYLFSKKGQPDQARRYYLAALRWNHGPWSISRSLRAMVKAYVARALGRPRLP